MSELDITNPDEQTNDELYEACSQAKDCFERGCVDDAVGWLQEARNIVEWFARLHASEVKSSSMNGRGHGNGIL